MHFILRQSSARETEFIISISKKVSKKAVVRNLIKRRVRPILKGLSPQLPRAQYLLIARSGAEKIAGPALEAELKSLFKLQ